MKKIVVLFAIVLSVNALAELTVIYDSGVTASIAPYLSGRVKKEPRTNKPRIPFSLPVITPSLVVGDVKQTTKSLPYLKQPFFLVGSDTRSQQWLLDNKAKLLSLNAVGMLIEAQTMKDIEGMALLAKGLRFFPASAESIANQLGLTYYPVLISANGWEQ